MVEATNYVYLAILICLQYLGLQHESYQITIDFSKAKEFEQRAPVSVDFSKTEDNENEWMLISPDKKHNIPLTIIKDSVIVSDSGMIKITKFNEIDFDRLKRRQDTIFNKKQVAVVITNRENKNIIFQMLDNTVYEKVTIRVNE